jgi:hypothetical protein
VLLAESQELDLLKLGFVALTFKRGRYDLK